MSAATLTAPPKASPSQFPRPVHWTVAAFHQANSLGLFENRRPVLIRGTIVEQGPMNPLHAAILSLISISLNPAFSKGWTYRVQTPLILGLDTDPMPDLAIVAGEPRDFMSKHPTTAALVAEVSDTTLALDTTEKAELYATGGIADYWVLDLENRQLIVCRDPAVLPENLGATVYQTRLELGVNDTISPLAAPTASIHVADLLP